MENSAVMRKTVDIISFTVVHWTYTDITKLIYIFVYHWVIWPTENTISVHFGRWSEQVRIQASDGATGDRYGQSVAISGDYAVVGAYADDSPTDSGSAYIFKKDTGAETWTQQAKLIASDAATSDNFGWDVGISGDTAVIGARNDDDGGSNSGSAYIFERSGTHGRRLRRLPRVTDKRMITLV